MTLPNLSLNGTRYVQETASPPPPSGNLCRVQTDAELNRRDRFPWPMVFHFAERKCDISKEWQLYLCAINYTMELRYVSALLNDGRMTNNNGDGFGDVAHCNWIMQRDLDAPPPRWSKVFTCGGATVEVSNGIVTLMDGSVPPQLRDGVFYPLARMQALNPNSYKYLPQTHPHLFYAAVMVNDDFTPRPFPNGATYSWYQNGQTPVSFLPHVADLRLGSVIYPPVKFSGNSARLVNGP
jgi:hypothetical protein